MQRQAFGVGGEYDKSFHDEFCKREFFIQFYQLPEVLARALLNEKLQHSNALLNFTDSFADSFALAGGENPRPPH